MISYCKILKGDITYVLALLAALEKLNLASISDAGRFSVNLV